MESKMVLNNDAPIKELQKQKSANKLTIVWINVLFYVLMFLSGIYGLYVMLFEVKFFTIVWSFTYGVLSILGVTAGTHRLWSHRSYKAKWPLKFLLMILQSATYQNSIYVWCRDHRLHHKYTDTDADPHNANRGFFFSHIGWLMVRKLPDVKTKIIDCSDLEQDPVVVFQKKWYMILMPLCTYILPTLIPYWFWGETLWYAWFANMCRFNTIMNVTFMVNSAAHKWGMKPYDKTIRPADNFGVSFVTLGEGWHNYHHTFPWDYRTTEFGNIKFSITTTFINFFAFLGLAYDLKTASADIIKQRVLQNSKITYIDKDITTKRE